MAKFELTLRTLNPVTNLWWKFMPGVTITVPWPVGYVTLWNDPSNGSVQTYSSDPNEHYRFWLESNVGKQGWDWNWKHGIVHVGTLPNSTINRHNDCVIIKFRKGKEHLASMAKLMWV